MFGSKIIFLLIIALGSVATSQFSGIYTVKEWIPNLNYENALNWVDNKIPAAGSDLIYPPNLFALTTLPNKVGSLILPRNGGFLLQEESETVLFDSSQNLKSQFKIPPLEPWLLSRNWRFTNSFNPAVSNAAVPHQEMIPCQGDYVRFSSNHTFRIDLQYAPKINFFMAQLSGVTLPPNKMPEFWQTEVGQLMFVNTDGTTVESGNCMPSPSLDIETDCECQASNVMDMLCENERNSCDVPHCFEPIQPIGHCCPICGGLAQIEALANFNATSLEQLVVRVEKQIQLNGYKSGEDVEFHISVVRDVARKRWIQLVVVDKDEYQGISTKLLASLKKTMLQPIFRESQQKIFFSGHSYHPTEHSHGFLFAFCTLLSVTVFLTLFYAYYYDNKYLPRLSARLRMRQFFVTPNIFARFENHPDADDGIENGIIAGESVVVNVEFPTQSQEPLRNSAFNNPMFEDELVKGAEIVETTSVAEEKSQVNIELQGEDEQLIEE